MGAFLQLDSYTLGEGVWVNGAVSTLDQELGSLPQLTCGFASRRVLDDGAALRTWSLPRSARVLAMMTCAPNDI
jgi:hypothetical protein